jgi:putative Mg2+ transporter-C (MgtC) family protein
MREFVDTLQQEFAIPGVAGPTRLVLRVLVAVVLGGVIGYNRQRLGKAAGLRTHVLVSLGSAVFVLAGLEAQMVASDLSRIVQGIVTGIGFLGGGVILKLSKSRQIRGVTTAATIWLTCGIGVAAGFGCYLLALLIAVSGMLALSLLRKVEDAIKKTKG